MSNDAVLAQITAGLAELSKQQQTLQQQAQMLAHERAQLSAMQMQPQTPMLPLWPQLPQPALTPSMTPASVIAAPVPASVQEETPLIPNDPVPITTPEVEIEKRLRDVVVKATEAQASQLNAALNNIMELIANLSARVAQLETPNKSEALTPVPPMLATIDNDIVIAVVEKFVKEMANDRSLLLEVVGAVTSCFSRDRIPDDLVSETQRVQELAVKPNEACSPIEDVPHETAKPDDLKNSQKPPKVKSGSRSGKRKKRK